MMLCIDHGYLDILKALLESDTTSYVDTDTSASAVAGAGSRSNSIGPAKTFPSLSSEAATLAASASGGMTTRTRSGAAGAIDTAATASAASGEGAKTIRRQLSDVSELTVASERVRRMSSRSSSNKVSFSADTSATAKAVAADDDLPGSMGILPSSGAHSDTDIGKENTNDGGNSTSKKKTKHSAAIDKMQRAGRKVIAETRVVNNLRRFSSDDASMILLGTSSAAEVDSAEDLEQRVPVLDRTEFREHKDESQNTMLMRACKTGSLKCVKYLLEQCLSLPSRRQEELRRTNSLRVNESRYANNRMNDAFTSAEQNEDCYILACKGGHLCVLDYILSLTQPSEVNRVTHIEGTAMQELILYFQAHPTAFCDFCEKSLSFERKDYLFALMPRILYQFDSPMSVLNECHDTLMRGLNFKSKRAVAATATADQDSAFPNEGRVLHIADDMAYMQTHPSEYQVVPALLYYAVALKKAATMKPHEHTELLEALTAVEQRLGTGEREEAGGVPGIMRHQCITKPLDVLHAITGETLKEALGNTKLRRHRPCRSMADYRATAFQKGPLSDYIEAGLSAFLVTAQISHLVDATLSKSQHPRSLTPLFTEQDLQYSLRSNSQSVRYIPSYVFWVEAGMKALALVMMICMVFFCFMGAVDEEPRQELLQDVNGSCSHTGGFHAPTWSHCSAYGPCMVLLTGGYVVSRLIHTYGNYKMGCISWKDELSMGCILLWLIIKKYNLLISYLEMNGMPWLIRVPLGRKVMQYVLTDLGPAYMGNVDYLLSAAITALFLSMQPYTLLHRELGELTIMILKVFSDLFWISILMVAIIVVLFVPFLTVFGNVTVGEHRKSYGHIFTDMIAAAMGQFETDDWIHINESKDSSNHSAASSDDSVEVSYDFRVLFFYSFIALENVVLFNLVLARLSASFQLIVDNARGELSMKKATTLKEYLNYPLRHPCCMLPPPLNIFPAVVYAWYRFAGVCGCSTSEAAIHAAGAVSDCVLCVLTSPVHAWVETNKYIDALVAEGSPLPHAGEHYPLHRKSFWALYYLARIIHEALLTVYRELKSGVTAVGGDSGGHDNSNSTTSTNSAMVELQADANFERVEGHTISKGKMTKLLPADSQLGGMVRTISAPLLRSLSSSSGQGFGAESGAMAQPPGRVVELPSFGHLKIDVLRLKIPSSLINYKDEPHYAPFTERQTRFRHRVKRGPVNCYIKISFNNQLFVSKTYLPRDSSYREPLLTNAIKYTGHNAWRNEQQTSDDGVKLTFPYPVTEIDFCGQLQGNFDVGKLNVNQLNVAVEVFDSYLGLFPDVKLGEGLWSVKRWITGTR